DVARLSRLDALSRLAARDDEIDLSANRSFGDFLAHRGDLHAVHARATPRRMGLDYACARLDARDFRRYFERRHGYATAKETVDDALSWDGLAHPRGLPATPVARSTHRPCLVGGRRHRLHRRGVFF